MSSQQSLKGGSIIVIIVWASLIAQLVKNPPATQETPVHFLGREDTLEKGKAIHSSILGLENSMDCILHGGHKE